MVRTDGFCGQAKGKGLLEDGGFIVESQLGDWPVYKVRCPSADDRQKPNIRFSIGTASCLSPMRTSMTPLAKHRLRQPQRSPNATHEALSVGVGSQEPLPSL